MHSMMEPGTMHEHYIATVSSSDSWNVPFLCPSEDGFPSIPALYIGMVQQVLIPLHAVEHELVDEIHHASISNNDILGLPP